MQGQDLPGTASSSPFRERWFVAGLAIRFLTAPLLLQWFHPDERQTLEFAHFLAHGSLHPFLESRLHLRNQTVPWLFSFVIRACDAVGLAHPWAYLTAFHGIVGLWSMLGFAALVACFRREFPAHRRAARTLGWFFAVFWGFPLLYSRMLLEALSFPAAALLLNAVRERRPGRAGFWAVFGGILRYPSALWAPGAALAAWTRRRIGARELAWALSGAAGALILGGLADAAVYGRFLDSASAYWSFNRPGGPVQGMFGDDSLEVYWRWFAYLFTPWLGTLALLAGAAALAMRRELLLFCLPYIAGHLWTPHREPRFLLPLLPFLALALWEAGAAHDFASRGASRWRTLPGRVRYAIVAMGALHAALALAWLPLYAWAQWNSAQGAVLRGYRALAERPTDLLTRGEPLIDALVPPRARWADPECRWHRPDAAAARLWVLADGAPPAPGCTRVPLPGAWVPPLGSESLRRILRVRTGRLWECPREALAALCPRGLTDAPPGEPLRADRL
jgi:hypothetical protein